MLFYTERLLVCNLLYCIASDHTDTSKLRRLNLMVSFMDAESSHVDITGGVTLVASTSRENVDVTTKVANQWTDQPTSSVVCFHAETIEDKEMGQSRTECSAIR